MQIMGKLGGENIISRLYNQAIKQLFGVFFVPGFELKLDRLPLFGLCKGTTGLDRHGGNLRCKEPIVHVLFALIVLLQIRC